MLKYALIENVLTDRPDDYSALTYAKESYDKAMFIKRLTGKGTLVTETDAIAALNAIENTVIEIIEEGSIINLPLFNTSFSISGNFNGPLDNFDSNRHKLNVNLSKGTLLRAAEKRVTVEKTNKALLQPNILEVKDSISGKKNEILTPNGVVEIAGHHIKISGDDPACGLWFIGNNTEIKAVTLPVNKPSTLIAIIPPLAKGTYQLKVVTQYSKSMILKKTRECLFSAMLEVL